MSNEVRDDYLVGFHISDIHFGCMDSKRLLWELENTFIKYIVQGIDIIVIAGDLFDRILTYNSKHSILFNKFWLLFIRECLRYEVKYIRVLKGTKSHDHDQLMNLIPYEDISLIDIKIINTVDSELIEGVSILYLPEEYMENQEEYYSSYFNNQYDMCFGHGMFKETAFTEHDGEFPIRTSPIFDLNEMDDVVKGPIMFGHIHNRVTFKNKLFYSGSYSSSNFSDNVKKGYNFFAYRKSDESYTVKFIENVNCRCYKTIYLSLDDTADNIISYINNYKVDNCIDKLKVRFYPEDSGENYQFLLINKNFVDDNEIIIEKSLKTKSKSKNVMDDKNNSDDISSITDKILNTTDLSEKIYMYHEHYNGEKYDIAKINQYLND